MNNFVKLSVLSAAILAGGMAMADARGGEPRPRPSFEEIDANGDGQITKEEMQAGREARFTSADTNGDGMLSAEELEAQMAARAKDRAAKMVERMDENGDGQISQDELPKPRRGGGERMFDRADANDDGALSKEEFEAAVEKMQKRHGKKHHDKG
ncbi:calcium-binding protein [Aliishimia ponticola]|uniref:Calcium-binding protein n=1 Tax=Aliishimia ponticola TaxID=2499833 RepID=A0A4S4N992_9RHOB|nr:EF-hand domain-containing protein [Aliishimia ponticola]THH35729.1 calcium-binding protein [Aliishimia ponticola]